jgi:hypothetical protein
MHIEGEKINELVRTGVFTLDQAEFARRCEQYRARFGSFED